MVHKEHPTISPRYQPGAPISPQAEVVGLLSVGDVDPGIPMSATVEDLIKKSTRGKTKAKYKTIRQKWIRYCEEKGQDLMAADTNVFLNFVGDEFDRGLKYSTIKNYISPLKVFMGNVDMSLVKQVLKGVFNIRPPTAKYACIWDVNILLNHLGNMQETTDMDISRKLACLLMVLSGNRVNMLSMLKVTNMFLTEHECTFVFDEVMKHSRPNFNDKPMIFRAFPYIQHYVQ